MSDVLAAFLYGQLESWAQIQWRRREIWKRYDESLSDWASDRGVRAPIVPSYCQQSFHMYYLLLPTPMARAAVIDQLKGKGILAVFHYQPLHLSEMGRRWGGQPGDCPVTEQVSDRLLRLPFYTDMTAAEQDRVIEAVTNAL